MQQRWTGKTKPSFHCINRNRCNFSCSNCNLPHKVPTTDQTVPEATAGSAMLSMETETSCEPTIQVTDMNVGLFNPKACREVHYNPPPPHTHTQMMERHGYVPDPAPTAGVESNASVETILPAHTNGTIDQGKEDHCIPLYAVV